MALSSSKALHWIFATVCVLLSCSFSVHSRELPPLLKFQPKSVLNKRANSPNDFSFVASTAAAQLKKTKAILSSTSNSRMASRFRIFALLATCCFSVQDAHGVSSASKLGQQIVLNAEERSIKKSNFSNDFVFGVSTAAAQIEGSAKLGGRGPSVWDDFIQKFPGKIEDGSNMDTAIDSYRRYKEDVKALKDIGFDSYRFSISWTRILTNGSLSGGVNQEGINHYNNLIDELIINGIKPYVTLFHFDSPQALQDKYGGPLRRSFVDDFKDYAEICFKTFGDRVKNWITINEPLIIAKFGHAMGLAPPGRCSDRKICPSGDSSTEPYIASHNLILAHATAARLYKEKFEAKQGGQIGLSLVGQYYEPYSNSSDDQAAAKRIMDFELGWYMEPLVYGDYPKSMREIVRDRLPSFSDEEKKLVKGSFDFIGVNYYTARYAKNIPVDLRAPPINYLVDQFVNATAEKDGVPIGPKTEGSFFLYVYPQGLQKILNFMKRYYQDPIIYISENGVTEKRNDTLKIDAALKDEHRIKFIQKHLYRIRRAIEDGVKVKGYFYWTLFDDFEWIEGFNPRFGLYYTDYSNNLTRIPKDSAKWFQAFLNAH